MLVTARETGNESIVVGPFSNLQDPVSKVFEDTGRNSLVVRGNPVAFNSNRIEAIVRVI